MLRLVGGCVMSYFIGYKIGNEVFRSKYADSPYYTPPPLFSWRLRPVRILNERFLKKSPTKKILSHL